MGRLGDERTPIVGIGSDERGAGLGLGRDGPLARGGEAEAAEGDDGDHHDEGQARDHERALPGPDHAGEQFPRRIVVRADPAACHVCGDVLGGRRVDPPQNLVTSRALWSCPPLEFRRPVSTPRTSRRTRTR